MRRQLIGLVSRRSAGAGDKHMDIRDIRRIRDIRAPHPRLDEHTYVMYVRNCDTSPRSLRAPRSWARFFFMSNAIAGYCKWTGQLQTVLRTYFVHTFTYTQIISTWNSIFIGSQTQRVKTEKLRCLSVFQISGCVSWTVTARNLKFSQIMFSIYLFFEFDTRNKDFNFENQKTFPKLPKTYVYWLTM